MCFNHGLLVLLEPGLRRVMFYEGVRGSASTASAIAKSTSTILVHVLVHQCKKLRVLHLVLPWL